MPPADGDRSMTKPQNKQSPNSIKAKEHQHSQKDPITTFKLEEIWSTYFLVLMPFVGWRKDMLRTSTVQQGWWDVTSVVRLKDRNFCFANRLPFFACMLWWSKLPCWRGPCRRDLRPAPYRQPAKDSGPQNNNLLGTESCQQTCAWKWILPQLGLEMTRAQLPWLQPMRDHEAESSAKLYSDFLTPQKLK